MARGFINPRVDEQLLTDFFNRYPEADTEDAIRFLNQRHTDILPTSPEAAAFVGPDSNRTPIPERPIPQLRVVAPAMARRYPMPERPTEQADQPIRKFKAVAPTEPRKSFTPIELTTEGDSLYQTAPSSPGFAGAFTNIRPEGELAKKPLESISQGTFSRVSTPETPEAPATPTKPEGISLDRIAKLVAKHGGGMNDVIRIMGQLKSLQPQREDVIPPQVAQQMGIPEGVELTYPQAKAAGYEAPKAGDKGRLSATELKMLAEEEKKDAAKKGINVKLNELKGLYEVLQKSGAIVDTKKSTLENIGNWLQSSWLGQTAGQITGTTAQSLRNRINNIRPLLLNDIRKATEQGARGLDSNKELEFYLQAATNPKLDVQSNFAALNVLSQAFAQGNDIVIPKDRAREIFIESGGDQELASEWFDPEKKTAEGVDIEQTKAPKKAEQSQEKPSGKTITVKNPETGEMETWDLETETRIR